MAAETVYDARCIASYLVSKAGPPGLDALQVMKLTYIAHGFTLAVLNKSLIEDDVEAWKWGPVIRSVYAVVPSGQRPFTNLLQPIAPADMEARDRGIVDTVLEKYGKHSGLYLSSLTHRPGSPWYQTWITYGQNAVIPKEVIRKHYSDVVKAWNQAAAANQPYWPDAL